MLLGQGFTQLKSGQGCMADSDRISVSERVTEATVSLLDAVSCCSWRGVFR